ncbi:hypothetical protein Hamer_G021902 [Homarus americanus]|uniref:Ig-like domain-containing protein n=1 Tax=Homarus americanus TaxID=6706 RepID=A0A8J5NE22_HOMAM|nr:hypothetical protein Hamer_G021902 [Homarus americanus]
MLLLTVIGVSAGMEIGPVRLAHNKRYISYLLGPSPENSLLECPYLLDEDKNEELRKITWNLWKGEKKVGAYEWFPEEDGIATGLLEGVVNMARDDGGLELTKLRYDLGGYYSCSGTLTNGEVYEAESWEVLVIDITSALTVSDHRADIKKCEFVTSVDIYAVFPEPTVHSGMYASSLGGFYDEVTALQWHKVKNENGSVSNSYHNVAFKINEDTPDDASHLVSIGVTKSDGNYIALTSIKSFDSVWQQQGCPAIFHKAYQVESYKNAIVKCDDGYHSAGHVKSLVLVCTNETGKYTWMTSDGDFPDHDKLRCVLGGGGYASTITSSLFTVLGLLFLLCCLNLGSNVDVASCCPFI